MKGMVGDDVETLREIESLLAAVPRAGGFSRPSAMRAPSALPTWMAGIPWMPGAAKAYSRPASWG
jgi:hypothetical protein